jgi:hypothetical protein
MNDTNVGAFLAMRALVAALVRNGTFDRAQVIALRDDILRSARNLEGNEHWDKSGDATQALRVFASDFAHDAGVSDIE